MTNKFSKMILMAAVSTVAFTSVSKAEGFDGIWDKDRFQVRGRVIDVIADGKGTVNQNGASTGVDNAIVPEVDLTYFFTKNIAAELIAATSEHTISAGGADLGDAWILPPTLTVQYHFQPEEKFSPYVGAGLNYSMFYGEDANSPYSKLDVDGGMGWALQAGFDYWLSDNWGLNFDVKYVDLNVDVRVNSGAASADNVELNPWIVGVGASYKF